MRFPSRVNLKDLSQFDQQAFRWGLKTVLISLLLIASYSLFPFKWSYPEQWSWQWFVDRFSRDELSEWQDLFEWLINLLAYSMLGYGLTGLLQRYRFKAIVQFVWVSIACASLVVTAESLQAFLPGRSPNLTDLLAGSCGGLIGCLIFHLYWLRSLRMAVASFSGYLLLTFLLSAAVPLTNDFRNWDISFPLLVGNELTGDRPWSGSVSEIQIFNRAFAPSEIVQLLSHRQPHLVLPDDRTLIAAYSFRGQGNYPDLAGHLPPLDWQGEAPETGDTEVFLDTQHWLQTTAPATYLTNQIRGTGEFTLSFLVASANLHQTGPARIISLSADTLRRNFTLGQQADALVLRFRTASTGILGNSELSIPQVFSDTHLHHLIVTYKNTVFQVYIDNVEKSYMVTLFPINRMDAYYGAIFIPLGLLLGIITLLSRRKSFLMRFLILSSIVLPPLALEVLSSSRENRKFYLGNIWLGLLLMLGMWLLVQGAGQLQRKGMFLRKAG